MNTFAKSIHKPVATAVLSLLICSSMVTKIAQANPQESPLSATDAASISEGYAVSGNNTSTTARSANTYSPSNFHHQTQQRPQIWISDIGTLLFDDQDGDGYHSGFSITIDVDSEFGDTEVYAKIYLEPSNQSAVLLHTTNHFIVYGNTSSDEYRVDTELRNNYVADYYSVSIDIHDAWTDELLDTANDRGFSNLKQLPLESGDMYQFDDNPSHFQVDEDDDYNHQHADSAGPADVVVTEYAGLFHPALLLAVAAGVLLRRRKR